MMFVWMLAFWLWLFNPAPTPLAVAALATE